jgi:diguanylate cyclase (GGDEF)-like protein
MLDIDNFKKYNDHYGHQAGDDCLRQVAQAIESMCATGQHPKLEQCGAFAARYGGEEFAVIVPGIAVKSLATLAQGIVKAVSHLAIAHEKNEAWGMVTLSIGAAMQEQPAGELVSLFRQADKRLYQAKQQGRNRAVTQG